VQEVPREDYVQKENSNVEGSSGMSKDGDNDQEEEKIKKIDRRMTKLETEIKFQGALDKLNVDLRSA